MKLSDFSKQLVKILRDDFGKGLVKALEPLLQRVAQLEEAVKAFPKQGDQGPAGEKGEAGLPGAPGKDGQTPSPEQLKDLLAEYLKTPMGIAVVQAAAAEEVKKIPAPENGKDALDIDLLPGIDVDKSVSRGTYATHEGGLWRAHQRTHGMKGWECIVDGVASIDVEVKGEREFVVKLTRSSGQVTERAFTVPTMIYRGTHEEGKSYLPGDTVTSSGSLWHCEKETTTRPGTGAEDWKLVAKRGADGARGKDGAPGERGLPGKDFTDPSKMRMHS